MSTSDLIKWRRSESVGQAMDMLRSAVSVGPVIWCLRMYDDHWSTRFRRPHDLHELARRARGEPPMALLPKIRKRSLTDPLPPLASIQSISQSIRRSRQSTDNQTKSSFLTNLPFEIRQLIYEEVLAGGDRRLIHILRKDGRLGHWRCRIQDGVNLCDSEGRRCLEGWLSYKLKVSHIDRTGNIDLITDDGLVPLLRTCRIIYSEAIKTVYSKNIFHFYDPGDIRYFSRSILPQRLNMVQSLLLDWERAFSIFNPYNSIPKQDNEEWKAWRETWGIIAKMESLREVGVILKKHGFFVSKSRRTRMCEPMMEIKSLSIFEVIVPEDDEGDWHFAVDAPFKIVKRSKVFSERGFNYGISCS